MLATLPPFFVTPMRYISELIFNTFTKHIEITEPEFLVQADGGDYELTGACRTLLDDPWTEHCWVVSMYHCRGGAEVKNPHEFLVLRIAIGQPGRCLYRSITVHREVNTYASRTNDRLTIRRWSKPPAKNIIAQVKFKLAIRLTVFLPLLTDAHRMGAQCVWFADSVFEASRAIWMYQGLASVRIVDRAGSLDRKIAPTVRKLIDNHRSTLMGGPTPTGSDEELEGLRTQFRAEIDKMKAESARLKDGLARLQQQQEQGPSLA